MKKNVSRQMQAFSRKYHKRGVDFEGVIARLKAGENAVRAGAQQLEINGSFEERLAFRAAHSFVTIAPILSNDIPLLQKSIRTLSSLKRSLGELREDVDKRGYGFFKCGNLKQTMDATLPLSRIRNLKDDIQSLLDACQNVVNGYTLSPDKTMELFEWLAEYERKQAVEQRMSGAGL